MINIYLDKNVFVAIEMGIYSAESFLSKKGLGMGGKGRETNCIGLC